ncbi:myogenesis-regulating glycosidase-like [Bradysia coprophila]|uniref:myogenesis-regulating glycosidase-like n=1 Tax=Bradysia coprophila TaxID=38358 RepID=UPI00187D802A|nr:myogenesis-regulating glycosidase-like [Bradysia coprophila]
MIPKILIVISLLSASRAQLDIYNILFENASDLTLRVQHQHGNNSNLSYEILRNSVPIHESAVFQYFGPTVEVIKMTDGLLLQGDDSTIQFSIMEDTDSFAMVSVERKSIGSALLRDCVQLKSTEMSWYGGPEQVYQYYPVEKLSFKEYSYVTKAADNCAIAERYWLNSRGLFIYIDKETPLFLNQTPHSTLCLYGQKFSPYYTRNGNSFSFNYKIGIASDARQAHLKAVEYFLKKPSGYPDQKMTTYPIFSTWAQYGRTINETVVLSYADAINEYAFNNSQMDIDDMWESCYGSLEFDTKKFPNIADLTSTLKTKGFRITLWVHPFINKGCEPIYSEALSKGYLVLDHNNSPDVYWWNTEPNSQSAHIDFTKAEAAQWYTDRLRTLQSTSGIDSFKFDAGEGSWVPRDPVLSADPNTQPNAATVAYIRTVVAFGSMIEVRSAFGQQNIPVFVRMLDKDSVWSWENGLPTLVTTLLQFNLAGYPFVLPDMIGGNGYEGRPSKELYIRWLQATVFMPALQFSFVPWDYDDETVVLSKKFTALHTQYADKIIERFKLTVKSGDPVNPPIWWTSPNDRTAQQINDQFLLGDDILVAPVLSEGKTVRNIYLPEGIWIDQNDGSVYEGPMWLNDYHAPLNVLPYFVRNSSTMCAALKRIWNLLLGLSILL